mmetsp:Transcript_26906/g.43159  ORF Transcript_26906/g.43159 Transcript_26906/m.43159 type:complete len:237 (-) Transcript_26906:59-769(-)
MDVVPHASSVWGVIVIPEHAEALPSADSYLLHKGHEVVGNRVWALTNPSTWVRADGVEVPEDRHALLLVGLLVVPHDLLNHELRPAVGIRASQCLLLIYWFLADPVDGRGGGKHDGLAVVVLHRLEDVEGPDDVVLVVKHGLRDRLPNCLESSKVDNAIELLLLEKLVHSRCVAHIDLEKRHLVTGDLLDAFQHLRACIHEAVHDGHPKTCFQQLHHGVGADVACATCAEDVRHGF